MPFAQHPHRLFKVFAQKVGHQKDDAPLGNHPAEIVESGRDIGLSLTWLEVKQLANQAQDMSHPFPWGNKQLNAVCKQNQADLVIVLDGGKCQKRAQLGRHLVLHFFVAAKRTGRRQVHHKNDGQLTLFLKTLHVGMPHACGHVPVYRAHLVTRLVFAHLVELHALPLENALILAGQNIIHGFAGVNLEVSNFLSEFFGDHGTSTVSKIFWTKSSEVFSSASAS